ncbi:unnamed protein product [Lathyrus sativus]|nr:unnamed protein product [Lathyrus sativus]
MAASTYLSLLLTISIIFISHAISPTSNPKLYQNVCKDPGEKDFEQRCLKLIESYPPLTLVKDYLTFCRSFVKMVAIEKTAKAHEHVKKMMNKYPSSQGIKECATEKYKTLVIELKNVLIEDAELISLNGKYACDALDQCEAILAGEKIVNVSSIYTLNKRMKLLARIVLIAGGNL